MWVLDWVLDVLFRLGLFYKQAKVLFLGLDNAGKTSLLNRLKCGSIAIYAPTTRANIEQFTCGGVTFTAFDVGGHEMWRHLWSTFYANVDAIVFVVDSVDQSRFPEVKDELLALLDDPDQGSVPFLVMLNKQDLREAVSAVDMVDILELRTYLGEASSGIDEEERGVRKAAVRVMGCSVLTGAGVEEALQWISTQIP